MQVRQVATLAHLQLGEVHQLTEAQVIHDVQRVLQFLQPVKVRGDSTRAPRAPTRFVRAPCASSLPWLLGARAVHGDRSAGGGGMDGDRGADTPVRG